MRLEEYFDINGKYCIIYKDILEKSLAKLQLSSLYDLISCAVFLIIFAGCAPELLDIRGP